MPKTDNQGYEAFDDLVQVQDVLGKLGFTLTANQTYHKDYGTANGTIIRISPIFDRGTPFDTRFKLCGINVSSNYTVNIVAGTPVEWRDIPKEAVEDTMSMVAQLTTMGRDVPEENHIMVTRCNHCNSDSPDYLTTENGPVCMECVCKAYRKTKEAK
jgi:hypothetical protein